MEEKAIENVDHELLTNRFHVTHYGGCAVVFNKDTFIHFSNSRVPDDTCWCHVISYLGRCHFFSAQIFTFFHISFFFE